MQLYLKTTMCFWLWAVLLCACGPGIDYSTLELQPFEDERGKYGYRDSRGYTYIPANFDMVTDFNDAGIAFVVYRGQWHCLLKSGVLSHQVMTYDNGPDPFVENRARYIELPDQYGFIDSACNVIIPARYDFARPFANGQAQVCKGCRLVADGEHQRVQGGRWFKIDLHGKLLGPVDSD